jgi:hypothetical protein
MDNVATTRLIYCYAVYRLKPDWKSNFKMRCVAKYSPNISVYAKSRRFASRFQYNTQWLPLIFLVSTVFKSAIESSRFLGIKGREILHALNQKPKTVWTGLGAHGRSGEFQAKCCKCLLFLNIWQMCFQGELHSGKGVWKSHLILFSSYWALWLGKTKVRIGGD